MLNQTTLREKPGQTTLSQGAHDSSRKHSPPWRGVDRAVCPCFSPLL